MVTDGANVTTNDGIKHVLFLLKMDSNRGVTLRIFQHFLENLFLEKGLLVAVSAFCFVVSLEVFMADY